MFGKDYPIRLVCIVGDRVEELYECAGTRAGFKQWYHEIRETVRACPQRKVIIERNPHFNTETVS